MARQKTTKRIRLEWTLLTNPGVFTVGDLARKFGMDASQIRTVAADVGLTHGNSHLLKTGATGGKVIRSRFA